MTRQTSTPNASLNRRALVGLGLTASLAASAKAAELTSGPVARVDESALRQKGAALDGHHDDLAVFQSFIDQAFAASPYNGAPCVFFDLPVGTILFSGPLLTGTCNVMLRGAGQDLTTLLMQPGGHGLLQHGTDTKPAVGYLQLQDIGLEDGNARGSGSTGVSVRFAANAPQSAMTWQGVALRRWAAPARIVDCPRNWHCENVTVFGPDFAMQAGAAFEIVSSPLFAQGCFTYVFINVLVANYTWGWNYDIRSPLEGQRFYSCTCYNGWGMVRARVHATPDRRDQIDETYRSVIWYFMECDWQGFGYAFDLVHCRNIIVRGGFYIANRNTDHLPIPDGRPRRRYMSFVGCGDILLDGVKFDVFTETERELSLVYVDSTSDQFRARDTNVLSYSPIDCAFEFAEPQHPNPKANTLSEIDTVWAAWSGGQKVRDYGNNQLAQSLARDLGGEMTASGRLTFQGETEVTGRTMRIALPRRPGNYPWFSKVPVVSVAGIGVDADVRIVDVTSTAISVRATAGVKSIHWTATGS